MITMNELMKKHLPYEDHQVRWQLIPHWKVLPPHPKFVHHPFLGLSHLHMMAQSPDLHLRFV